ncbi:MAG: hypothetical protein ACPLRM_01500, partial [Anaerolineae bacterium]
MRGGIVLIPVGVLVRINDEPKIHVRARQRLARFPKAVLSSLATEVAQGVTLADRLVLAEHYVTAPYMILSMAAGFMVGMLGQRRFDGFETPPLVPPAMFEVPKERAVLWYVLPGLVASDARPGKSFAGYLFREQSESRLAPALAKDLGCSNDAVVVGPGLAWRVRIPQMFDERAAEDLMRTLAGGQPVGEVVGPFSESVYALAAWPEYVEVPYDFRVRTKVPHTLRVTDRVSAETIQKLKNAGWEVVVETSGENRRKRPSLGRNAELEG